jgi:hypothetical protein
VLGHIDIAYTSNQSIVYNVGFQTTACFLYMQVCLLPNKKEKVEGIDDFYKKHHY